MDRDFHFFGTFAAAAWAGFTERQAMVVASAAQFVDDCTEAVTHKSTPFRWWPRQMRVHGGAGHLFTPIITSVANMKSWAGTSNGDETRQIWMPFHFLPGNASSDLDPVVVRENPDGEALDLLCRPRSASARDLVEFAVARYGELSVVDEELALMLVGICMHVFADTFAHQDFAGTASSKLNATRNGVWENTGSFTNKGVWKGRRWEPDEGSKKPIAWPWAVQLATQDPLTAYSTVPMDTTSVGHGQMGHLPDVSSIAFDYDPRWSGESVAIDRNNPEAFLACFMEMVRALRAVLKGDAFSFLTPGDGADEAFVREEGFYARVQQAICPTAQRACDRALYESGMNMPSAQWFGPSEARWSALIADAILPASGVTGQGYERTRNLWVSQAGGRQYPPMPVSDFKATPFVKWNCAAKAIFSHLFDRFQRPGSKVKMLRLDATSIYMPPQFNLVDEIAEFWVPERGLGAFYTQDRVAHLKERNQVLMRAETTFEIETLFFS